MISIISKQCVIKLLSKKQLTDSASLTIIQRSFSYGCSFYKTFITIDAKKVKTYIFRLFTTCEDSFSDVIHINFCFFNKAYTNRITALGQDFL